jgi:hypothetical protein
VAIGSEQDLTDAQRKTLGRVKAKWDAAEKLHSQLRPKWEVFYGLSRNYRRLQSARAQATTPRDQDTVMESFRRVFGTELFVPYVYTVIETVVPRICTSIPAVGVLPLEEDAIDSCGRLMHLYERDLRKIDYDTTYQEVVRSGLRYGLGVQKGYWSKEFKQRPKVTSRLLGVGSKVEVESVLTQDGPDAEAVDIFDFRWDPSAHDIASASYVIHRTWRDFAYIKARVQEGIERRAKGEAGGWLELELDKVKGLGSESAMGEAWSGRMEAAGLSSFDTAGERKHEVWEFHDGENVYTVLDRTLLVQEARNPYNHREIPFQIYRPTLIEHEFVGIGEVEPLAHLQFELNTMRGQRRDAATLAMERGYFYQVGTLDPNTLVTGAGAFNPVFGNPSESVQPMPFSDIPQSGVSEEEALKHDIELTSGISEAVIGSSGEETATGTQLVQAAANLRIKQKAQNGAKQVLKPMADQWLEMYRQHITDDSHTRSVRVPDAAGYSFIKVTAKDVQANLEVAPDENPEPDSAAQRRSDARELAVALAPFAEVLDMRQLIKHLLSEYGIENGDEWLKAAAPAAPAGPDAGAVAEGIGANLQRAGVEPQLIQDALGSTLQQLQQSGQEPQPQTEG